MQVCACVSACLRIWENMSVCECVPAHSVVSITESTVDF